LDSKREMDIMNALDEMQSLNKRHERVDTAAALAALQRSAESEQARAAHPPPARPPARAPQRAAPPLATGRPDRVPSSTWAAARERLRTAVQDWPPQPPACLAGGRPDAGAARIMESLSWAKLALPRQNRPCRVRGGEPSAPGAAALAERGSAQHYRAACRARKHPPEKLALFMLCTKTSA